MNFQNEQTKQGFGLGQTTSEFASSKADFIRKTYQFFAASLLAASVGAYVGMGFAPAIAQYYWGLVILELALLFGMHFTKNKQGLNIVLLFAFTFITGLTITPILAVTLAMPGGAGIVTNAFVLTTVAFGGLSVFAMNTKKDFTTMGKMLFIALIVLIVAGVINIFTQSSMLSIAISSISAILFSAFILYDTQNIIRGNYQTPIDGAVALYLDFLNLFVSLLHILGIFSGDD
jgi:modulator of FtsH protease